MNNMALMNQTVQKLAVVANKPVTADTTILGHFVQFNDENHMETYGIIPISTLS